MIHFFLTFSKTAADSPFSRRLDELGVQYQIIPGEVRHRYRGRFWMTLVGRPMTAWFALRAAIRSMLVSDLQPDVVVVWTHIEALIAGLVRAARQRRGVKIVLVGFILTQRAGRLHRWLRDRYFGAVFRIVDMAVVHSSVERERYSAAFPRVHWVFIPWGSNIEAVPQANGQAAQELRTVLSAGRSGRDYRTFYRAFATGPFDARIVCDMPSALDGCVSSPFITVLDRCHGTAYVRELLAASVVVIPLAVGDISAGQMVLMQAMQLGKPIVITRTATIVDYLTPDHDALFVEADDAKALFGAVERLLSDKETASRLGANAVATFANRFTLQAMVTSLVREIHAFAPHA